MVRVLILMETCANKRLKSRSPETSVGGRGNICSRVRRVETIFTKRGMHAAMTVWPRDGVEPQSASCAVATRSVRRWDPFVYRVVRSKHPVVLSVQIGIRRLLFGTDIAVH